MRSEPSAVRVELTKRGEASLSFAEAMVSPCATCATSPCCRFLPLTSFQARTLGDLDNAVYLLNFDRIELGLSRHGDWHVYYRAPCRFLSPDDASCTVHGTADQPNICVHYSAYSCWYRTAYGDEGGDTFLRLDRRRLETLLAAVRFDDLRRIVEVPTWEALSAAFAGLPVSEEDAAPSAGPAGTNGGTARPVSITPRPPAGGRSFDEVRNPCAGCGAWCCTTLAFPIGRADSVSSLDYVRFALGFPGVTVAVADDEWSLLVETTCRHLEGTRCGVYGRDERPLRCRYYDEWSCTYKRNLGPGPPATFARVDLSAFDRLAATYRFDADGAALHVPTGGEIAGSLGATRGS